MQRQSVYKQNDDRHFYVDAIGFLQCIKIGCGLIDSFPELGDLFEMFF